MKTILKKLSLIIIFTGLLFSCSDKQAELIKLKKERASLDEKIIALEKEIANDTTIEKSKDNGISITAKKLSLAPFEHFVEIHGRLDGEDNIMLYPKSQGVVQKVFVQLGDRVSKGQVLATLESGALEKTLEQTKTQYELAKDMYERQKRLWEQNIGSEVQYLQTKTQKESLEQAVASLKEQLDYTKIMSPINGHIEDLPLKIGMAVSPAMPVATVINFSSLKVVAEVAEAYSMSIKTGDPVTVIFPDLNSQVNASISSASNYISQVNRSFKIEVRLPNKIPNLKANMIAVLKIIDYKSDNAISIPVNLIQTDSKGNYVYVVKSDGDTHVAHKNYITQGKSYNGTVEITDGLKPGEMIITSGHLSVADGAKIEL